MNVEMHFCFLDNQGQIVHRRKMENIKKKTTQQINVKDVIFYNYIFEMYILADIKRNCRKSRFI